MSEQQGGVMKLSEAIRLGAMMRPQGFNGTNNIDLPAVCAFGAASVAMSSRATMCSLWPWLASLPSSTLCPECLKVATEVGRSRPHGLIPHLNNDHRWTRERIADWVATIEPADGDDPIIVTKDEAVEAHV